MSSNAKQKPKGTQTIFWWIVWIALTIGSFFVASAFWTPLIAKWFGSIRETTASIAWVATVFGTWMIILVPLIIVMYSKVDKTYEDARLRREKNAARFRSIYVDPAQRILSEEISKKVSSWPQTIEGGHLVNVTLSDGRKVENVFVSAGKEVLGVYNASEFSFQGWDVKEVEPVDFKKTPEFLTNRWLRLDGVQVQE